MSHKHYRKPARPFIDETRQSPPAMAPAADPIDVRCLSTVKKFLEIVLKRAINALEEVEKEPAPTEPTQRETIRKHVTAVSRLGIAACRALMQAMRLQGADTKAVSKLVDETVLSLTARAAQHTAPYIPMPGAAT
jgi:hypothetical protein